ncbi:MAG TPA: nucleotide exchange factor GrpE [Pseudonocardiaceae bacterium]
MTTPPEQPGPDRLDELIAEVAGLRDLFSRRLLEDRARQQLYDQLYRQLEFANGQLARQFVAPLLRELLLVVDRIETAGRHGTTEDLVDSIRLELLDVLERRDVRRIAAVDGPFDPAVHTAVRQTPVAPDRDHLVTAEIRPGYLFGDQVLRPAEVEIGRHHAAPRESADMRM